MSVVERETWLAHVRTCERDKETPSILLRSYEGGARVHDGGIDVTDIEMARLRSEIAALDAEIEERLPRTRWSFYRKN